jgi:hypothetical protein
VEIVLPKTLKQFSHDQICKILKRLNSRFSSALRGSWPKGLPDLEDPVTREVVEVAVSRELKTSWGQCLYYYRMGASEIHLILSPRLFLQYKNDESGFIRENPIPNVVVHTLPDIRLLASRERKPKNGKRHKKNLPSLPMLQYVTFGNEMVDAIKLEDVKGSESAMKSLDTPSVEREIDLNELIELKKILEDPDCGLVPILTPIGDISYISVAAYEKEKNLHNFWMPISDSMIQKLHCRSFSIRSLKDTRAN